MAVEAGWGKLQQTGQALDAVEAGCNACEDDPENHTVGYSGYPDRSGRVSLDASIMQSPGRCGSVCFVRKYAHVASIARRVMEQTEHVMLAGDGAEAFAASQGFTERELLTPEAKAAWEKWIAEKGGETWLGLANIEERQREMGTHDTVGVLGMDGKGRLAGACSTSGLAFKLPGRVGDSPIIGHGLYVEPGIGAAVATGNGELVMGVCGGFLAVDILRRGGSPAEAGRQVIQRIAETYELDERKQVGLIVLGADGNWSASALRKGFTVAERTESGNRQVEPGYVHF